MEPEQPLLAAEIFWVEHLLWDYRIGCDQNRQEREEVFQPMTTAEKMALPQSGHSEPVSKTSDKQEAKQQPDPTFGPCCNTQVVEFNFEKEVEHLPFKVNIGTFHWKKPPGQFISLIYSNW